MGWGRTGGVPARSVAWHPAPQTPIWMPGKEDEFEDEFEEDHIDAMVEKTLLGIETVSAFQQTDGVTELISAFSILIDFVKKYKVTVQLNFEKIAIVLKPL